MTEAEVQRVYRLIHTRDCLASQLAKIDASSDTHVYVRFEKVNVSVSRQKVRDGVAAELSAAQAALDAAGVLPNPPVT